MFDIGFSEIIVCAVVGLVVIGPERLPETVRTVGLWVGRIKRSLRETREDLERQVGMDDIRKQLHTEEMMRTLDDMQEEIDAALNYERMGKNKPIIEHLPDPISDSSLANSAVESLPSQPTLPDAKISNSDVNVNLNTAAKIPSAEPKKDSLSAHH